MPPHDCESCQGLLKLEQERMEWDRVDRMRSEHRRSVMISLCGSGNKMTWREWLRCKEAWVIIAALVAVGSILPLGFWVF